MTWQPIETAPSETNVLVWDGEDVSTAQASRSSHGLSWHGTIEGQLVGDEHGSLYHVRATHWMPLPEAPAS